MAELSDHDARKARAIGALIAGEGIRAVARATGFSASTVSGWRQDLIDEGRLIIVPSTRVDAQPNTHRTPPPNTPECLATRALSSTDAEPETDIRTVFGKELLSTFRQSMAALRAVARSIETKAEDPATTINELTQLANSAGLVSDRVVRVLDSAAAALRGQEEEEIDANVEEAATRTG